MSISFLKSSKIFFMYLGASILGAYIFTMLCLLGGFFPWELWSDLLVSLYGPFFEVYFVWYEYCYPGFFFFFLFHMLGIVVSSPSLSVCVSVLFWGRSAYVWVMLSCPSAIPCLLIGAFNSFTFKVIIDRYLFIAIFLYLYSSLFYCFSSCSQSKPFSISYRAVLQEVYFLRLLLSEKILIWPSILIESLAGQNSLVCRRLVFITWNISCHSLMAWSVSIEKSVSSLIWTPLYVTSCFSLAAFKILSLSWNFAILIMMCLQMGLFGVLLVGTVSFLDLCDFFSHHVRDVFHHYFFKQIFYPLLFFFWLPYSMDIISFPVVLHFP